MGMSPTRRDFFTGGFMGVTGFISGIVFGKKTSSTPPQTEVFGKPVLVKRRKVLTGDRLEPGIPNIQSLASATVCDRNGKVKNVFSPADDKQRINIHSAIKVLHGGLLVEENEMARRGGRESFEFGPRQIAILVSSHGGSQKHTDEVLEALRITGIDENLIVTHRHPFDETARDALIRANVPISETPPRYDQCSGHHTSQLIMSKLKGLPLQDYNKHDGELQRQYLQGLQTYSGDSNAKIVAYDNCKVPTFEVSMPGFATAYARFIANSNFKPVVDAVTQHPVLIGDETSIDSNLILVTKGNLIAKGGAEGSLIVINKKLGDALILKEWSGNWTLRDRIIIEALKELRWITDREAETLFSMKSFALRDDEVGIVYDFKKPLWA